MTPEQVAATLAARTPGLGEPPFHVESLAWTTDEAWGLGTTGQVGFVNTLADARAITLAVNLSTHWHAVAEAARRYSPQHDWRCEFRTRTAGWQPGGPPVIRCECGCDELQHALAALDTAMEKER